MDTTLRDLSGWLEGLGQLVVDLFNWLWRTSGSAVDKVLDLQFLDLTIPEFLMVGWLAVIIIWKLGNFVFGWWD